MNSLNTKNVFGINIDNTLEDLKPHHLLLHC